MRLVAQRFGAAVVDDDHMDLLARLRTSVQRRIGRHGLPRGRTRQQTGEDRQRTVVGDDLLQPHDRDMQIGKRRPQIGVALVGADCEGPL